MVAQPESVLDYKSLVLSRVTDVRILLNRIEAATLTGNRHAADLALDEAVDALLAAREANDRGQADFHPDPEFTRKAGTLMEMHQGGRLPVLDAGEEPDD